MDLNEKIIKLLKIPKIQRYLNKSIKVATYKTKTKIDDSDIYHIKLISCWKAILNFKPYKNGSSKFVTYLSKVAYSQTLKFLKKNKPLICNGGNFDRLCVENHLQFEILEFLTNPHKDIVKMFFLDRFTKKEISEKLKISQFKVRKIIEESKKIIKENYPY